MFVFTARSVLLPLHTIKKLCLDIIFFRGPGSLAGIATTGWTARNRIPVGTRFSARPNRSRVPPSLLYNGYRVFPGGKLRPGRAADHSPPFYYRGHGRVELHLYPPSGPHRVCNGITAPLHSCWKRLANKTESTLFCFSGCVSNSNDGRILDFYTFGM